MDRTGRCRRWFFCSSRRTLPIRIPVVSVSSLPLVQHKSSNVVDVDKGNETVGMYLSTVDPSVKTWTWISDAPILRTWEVLVRSVVKGVVHPYLYPFSGDLRRQMWVSRKQIRPFFTRTKHQECTTPISVLLKISSVSPFFVWNSWSRALSHWPFVQVRPGISFSPSSFPSSEPRGPPPSVSLLSSNLSSNLRSHWHPSDPSLSVDGSQFCN